MSVLGHPTYCLGSPGGSSLIVDVYMERGEYEICENGRARGSIFDRCSGIFKNTGSLNLCKPTLVPGITSKRDFSTVSSYNEELEMVCRRIWFPYYSSVQPVG